MGKTRRSDEESKQQQILELKGRLKLQKKEIARLNRRVKGLERDLEGKLTKVKKDIKVEKSDKKKDLIDKLREEFSRCKI